MRGRSFNSMLSGQRLGTLLRWQKAHKCPCTGNEGEAERECGVCFGRGRYYDAWSQEFRAGFVGQETKAIVQMLKQMGMGADVGDAVLILPVNAPCFDDIGLGDRIQVVEASDTLEWSLSPGVLIRLPESYEPVDAMVRSVDGQSVVSVAFPVPGPDGRVSVAVPTVVHFRVARLYEVPPQGLPKVRSFSTGPLPKKVAMARVDWTVR